MVTKEISRGWTAGILVCLALEYLLGMYVALFAAFPDEPEYLTESIIPKIAFGIHGLLGLILLIISVVILVLGMKAKQAQARKLALYGFLSILLAFGAGMATVMLKETASEVSSFVMSAGFLLSFVWYWKLYYS